MTTKEKAKDARLKRIYGKSLSWYNKQFKKQGGVCAMCSRPPKRLGLFVDHNHKSGQVRALLCMICNRKILGLIEKYKIVPQRIVDYLKQYDSDNPLVKG
jgi:hypothetical protein